MCVFKHEGPGNIGISLSLSLLMTHESSTYKICNIISRNLKNHKDLFRSHDS